MKSSPWRTFRFIVVCLAIAGYAAYHTWAIYREKAPAQLTTEFWGRDYKGQKWVSVRGQMIEKEIRTVKEGDGTQSAYVPMGVAGEPKMVVVYINAQNPDALNSIVEPLCKREVTVEGYIPMWSHLPDDAGLVNIAPNAVKLEMGEKPHMNTIEKALAVAGMGCVLLLLLWAIGAAQTFSDRRRLNKTKNEPLEDLNPFRHYMN
jgi:hypothetical protein